MLFSLLMMATSGWYLISALKEKSTQTVQLKKIDKEPAPQTSEEKPPFPTESSPLQDPLTEGTTTQAEIVKSTASAAEKSMEAKPRPKKRNILFKLYSSRAKKVHIIGDFTNWKRRPLKKESPKTWTTSVRIKPGSYKYLYVVDGRRTKDPNNKKVQNGKSVLKVKPFTQE